MREPNTATVIDWLLQPYTGDFGVVVDDCHVSCQERRVLRAQMRMERKMARIEARVKRRERAKADNWY